MGCHFLLQRLLLTHGSKLCLLYLLHFRQIPYQLSYRGSPHITIIICIPPCYYWVFPAVSVSEELPTMQKTQVWSLGWKYPLEKEMATHSTILSCRIPWVEERGGLQSMGSQRLRSDWVNSTRDCSLGAILKIIIFAISYNSLLLIWSLLGFRHRFYFSYDIAQPFNCHFIGFIELLLFSWSVMSDCDPLDCSIPSIPVLYYLLEFAQTHVHWINNAI